MPDKASFGMPQETEVTDFIKEVIMENLKAKAFALRQDVIRMIREGKAGHIGGDMSVMDILVSLYFHTMNVGPENMDDPGRDKFVLSKGHSVEALYAVLAA